MGFKGSIGTDQKCPKCGGKFEFVNNDVGLMCKADFNRPTRYWISAKSLGIPNKKYSSRLGKVFETWGAAVKEWTAMNSAYNESLSSNGKPFNPDDWIASEVKLQEFQNKAQSFIENLTALYVRGKRSKARYRAVRNSINKFLIPFFKGKDIREITKEQVKEFYYYLLDLKDDKGERYSDFHIRDIMATLKTLLSRFRPDVPEFPEHTVTPKREKQWLGIERQIAIEPHIPEKYRLPVRLLQETGMRVGELRALQVKDMVDGSIRVWKAFNETGLKLSRKSGGEVVHKLSLDLWSDLKAHTEGLEADAFIFHSRGASLRPQRPL